MKKMNQKGFSLAELLIVVAIIAVLVAIAIPTFSDQMERSREAVDISNLRNAYSLAMSKILMVPVKTYPVVVEFKQQAEGWSTDTSDLPFTLPDDFKPTASDGAQTLFFTKKDADKDKVDVDTEAPKDTPAYSNTGTVSLPGLKVGAKMKEVFIAYSSFINDDAAVDTPTSIVAVDFGKIKGLEYEEADNKGVKSVKISGMPKNAIKAEDGGSYTGETVTIYMLDKNGVLGSYSIPNVTVDGRT